MTMPACIVPNWPCKNVMTALMPTAKLDAPAVEVWVHRLGGTIAIQEEWPGPKGPRGPASAARPAGSPSREEPQGEAGIVRPDQAAKNSAHAAVRHTDHPVPVSINRGATENVNAIGLAVARENRRIHGTGMLGQDSVAGGPVGVARGTEGK
ncbi:MAG: hypothetical protein F4186_04215 [Boseongicola sp. SB0676_bin_33]|uniref:Uncharacterized protein n=1 Tax=Boseongicola sp. SB0664_bin_43 TaxID=2604844 RepID=A0A6B0Y012_9RHOB|nr:hypothetical protein [Boseongicola sp. SB0664_bin_43]MYF88621.1 hypothetical protein [Boseongicola sp. SB0676_bin_33]MYK33008.1 hypothetical protein [Boseongicola sp. SB0670_bin_30]